MEEVFINKVANSGIETINLEEYFPVGERVFIDVKELLFMGLVLKEKDFRDWIKTHNWEQYSQKYVAIYCSSDAIVPTWAFMLISTKLSGIANKVVFGDLNALEATLWESALNELNIDSALFLVDRHTCTINDTISLNGNFFCFQNINYILESFICTHKFIVIKSPHTPNQIQCI